LQFTLKTAKGAENNMSTSTADITAAGAGSLSSEKKVYRRYVKFATDKDGKTTIDEQRILSESDGKDSKTGLAVNWQNAEDDGFVLFAQNDVVNYTVKDSAGFELLCPDEEIRMYVVNTGLSTIQTARANGYMKAMAENTAEPEPLYNDVTLDLRVGVGEDGEYSINKTPSRRSLSDMEKLIKNLRALGLSDDSMKDVLMAYAKAKSEVTEATAEVA
jgi:hypothetical protein